MGRRSDHTREELASLVLNAAKALVAQGGRGAVTARAIAGRIGYAPGSIYNAVGDLRMVILRVNADTLDRLAETLTKVIERKRGADSLETVLAVADAYIRFATTHFRLWSAVLEPGLAVGTSPEGYSASRARLTGLVVRILEPFYPERRERERAAVALWASLQGVAALSIAENLELEGREFDPTDVARSLVCRYLSGSEKHKGKRSRTRS